VAKARSASPRAHRIYVLQEQCLAEDVSLKLYTVRSSRLVREQVAIQPDTLIIGDRSHDRAIVVVMLCADRHDEHHPACASFGFPDLSKHHNMTALQPRAVRFGARIPVELVRGAAFGC
jgi:hypothetical protein